MKQQLPLIDAPTIGWKRLDRKTIETGRKGVAAAREALRAANERLLEREGQAA